ncbi:actin-binding protein IPP-like [Saccostrea cucullata]|uniref:actin-binding protein IPP-like n=1 Tax=Saccostrea cuccullata TaxID=36930 RepID=UPI002ED3F775
MSSDSSINHSTASNTSRPSPRSVTNMSSDSSINYSTGSNRSSPRMVTCKGSVCSINDSASKTNSLSFKRKSESAESDLDMFCPSSYNFAIPDKDLNENTKKENSDPAIEQTQDNVSHYNNLGEYISQKYQRHEICDICFKLGDTLYPAHKLVLASQSTLFADVFERESFSNTPVAPKVIKVRGVSEEALVSFLDFLYTGKMDINSVCLSDVFKLAAVFKVDQIKRLCVRKVEQLKCQDLLQLLPTMAKLKESGICELIIRKITHNFLEVKEDPEFFNLDLDTLCMILASDNVNVRSEFEIFAAAVSWIQHHDFDQRIHHIEKLMNCVRFTLMTSQELFLCFKKFPVLKQNKNCVNMITTANWYIFL